MKIKNIIKQFLLPYCSLIAMPILTKLSDYSSQEYEGIKIIGTNLFIRVIRNSLDSIKTHDKINYSRIKNNISTIFYLGDINVKKTLNKPNKCVPKIKTIFISHYIFQQKTKQKFTANIIYHAIYSRITNNYCKNFNAKKNEIDNLCLKKQKIFLAKMSRKKNS